MGRAQAQLGRDDNAPGRGGIEPRRSPPRRTIDQTNASGAWAGAAARRVNCQTGTQFLGCPTSASTTPLGRCASKSSKAVQRRKTETAAMGGVIFTEGTAF